MRASARGLSMLEVILSAGILFLVMLVLLNLATTSLWGSKEGGERLSAEAHALSLLERYRAVPFPSYPLGQPQSSAQVEDGTEYRMSLLASPVEGVSPDRLRQLTVTVSWDSKRGPREAVLSAYVAPILR